MLCVPYTKRFSKPIRIREMKIAIVGATGVVGSKMIEILEERNVLASEIIPVASVKSVGKEVLFRGQKQRVRTIEEAVALRPDYALFSAGASVSLEWAPIFAQTGCTVIDNSSAWRMSNDVPLVVPEINMHAVKPFHRIIANPNCSTIQMVMALAPLHKRYRIDQIVVSTYQSVSGSGQKGTNQLIQERESRTPTAPAFTHPIDLNLIPQIDLFLENGYTKEEMKMVFETRKILEDDAIIVIPTAVRVPVLCGHSESVYVKFHQMPDLEEVVRLMSTFPGLVVAIPPQYHTPLNCVGKDDVFVGRIRHDLSSQYAINMWIVSDNLRKGAATNAVQILEQIIDLQQSQIALA
ncbi:MAG: aspartate-semialdehyde dehydrogenase [Prevotellaceae bacterium]|nr:aspartate-semialdehyde dehydrogenase [Prevotellaceae bacterium]